MWEISLLEYEPQGKFPKWLDCQSEAVSETKANDGSKIQGKKAKEKWEAKKSHKKDLILLEVQDSRSFID